MRFSIAILAALLSSGALACLENSDCGDGHLCVRNRCKLFLKSDKGPEHQIARSRPSSVINNATCWQGWPDVTSCVQSWENRSSGYLMVESNNVPDFDVPAYCPFGVGQGYCQSPTQGNSTDCAPFRGKVCPCEPGSKGCPANTTSAGDVMVPSYQLFMIPLNPDPTLEDRPLHMYNNSALTSGNSYQVIGVMNNGVQIKGPAEANGYNVDTSLIPLPCGGHVTPPVGPGPIYHFHKAPDCLDNVNDGFHRLGTAADGFGIYGYENTPLDECNGQFGPIDVEGTIAYHYHARGVYNLPNTPHKPYYMGCLGPSKGRCNETVSEEYDGGANWCGEGCGADLCVAPGTSKQGLVAYLDRFTGAGTRWLSRFTINCDMESDSPVC